MTREEKINAIIDDLVYLGILVIKDEEPNQVPNYQTPSEDRETE